VREMGPGGGGGFFGVFWDRRNKGRDSLEQGPRSEGEGSVKEKKKPSGDRSQRRWVREEEDEKGGALAGKERGNGGSMANSTNAKKSWRCGRKIRKAGGGGGGGGGEMNPMKDWGWRDSEGNEQRGSPVEKKAIDLDGNL